MTSAIDRLDQPIRAVTLPTAEVLSPNASLKDVKLNGASIKADVASLVTDAVVTLTMHGISTFDLTLRDWQKTVLRSGLLAELTAATVEDLEWAYTGSSKQGRDLILHFQPALVDAMQDIKKRRVSTRSPGRNRAMFIRDRVAEISPTPTYTCPEIEGVQPITKPSQRKSKKAKQKSRDGGFAPGAKLTVKGVQATSDQRSNLERVLAVGASLGAVRVVQLSAIVCVIQESDAKNLKGGDRDSVGLFQQRHSQGWPATRIAEVDAKAYYDAAIANYKKTPSISAGALAQSVQSSAFPAAYAQWGGEAEKILALFDPSLAAGTKAATDGVFQFSIGPPGGDVGEDYWTGFQRLADEVTWALFLVGNDEIVFISEPKLVSAAPVDTISEDDDYIDNIDYDSHKRYTTDEADVTARVWGFPYTPGSVLVIEDTGDADGRWLIESIERSLIVNPTLATVHVVKPRAATAEPAGDTSGAAASSATGLGNMPAKAQKAYAKAVDIAGQGLIYSWGGGHSSFAPTGGSKGRGYDCSGAVSAVLHAAGELTHPETTGPLESFGKPGKGKFLTVYSCSEHCYLEFNVPGKGLQRWAAENSTGVGFKSDSPPAHSYVARHIEGC